MNYEYDDNTDLLEIVDTLRYIIDILFIEKLPSYITKIIKNHKLRRELIISYFNEINKDIASAFSKNITLINNIINKKPISIELFENCYKSIKILSQLSYNIKLINLLKKLENILNFFLKNIELSNCNIKLYDINNKAFDYNKGISKSDSKLNNINIKLLKQQKNHKFNYQISDLSNIYIMDQTILPISDDDIDSEIILYKPLVSKRPILNKYFVINNTEITYKQSETNNFKNEIICTENISEDTKYNQNDDKNEMNINSKLNILSQPYYPTDSYPQRTPSVDFKSINKNNKIRSIDNNDKPKAYKSTLIQLKNIYREETKGKQIKLLEGYYKGYKGKFASWSGTTCIINLDICGRKVIPTDIRVKVFGIFN